MTFVWPLPAGCHFPSWCYWSVEAIVCSLSPGESMIFSCSGGAWTSHPAMPLTRLDSQLSTPKINWSGISKHIKDRVFAGTVCYCRYCVSLSCQVARRMKLQNVARCAGMSGGRAVELMAEEGHHDSFRQLHRVLQNRQQSCHFTFSGLKTLIEKTVAAQEREYGTIPVLMLSVPWSYGE